jgi:hypothetical protein
MSDERARRRAFPNSAGRRDGREEHPCAAPVVSPVFSQTESRGASMLTRSLYPEIGACPPRSAMVRDATDSDLLRSNGSRGRLEPPSPFIIDDARSVVATEAQGTRAPNGAAARPECASHNNSRIGASAPICSGKAAERKQPPAPRSAADIFTEPAA